MRFRAHAHKEEKVHPQPLFYLFGLDSLPVYAYGLCMAAGLLACFGFLLFTMSRKKFNEEAADKILLIGIFGAGFGIFSAMLFQSFYDYIDDLSKGGEAVFSLSGSMTFIGGLIGGVVGFLAVYWLYIYVVAPRTKIKVLQNRMNATLTDALPFIPIGIVIAHAFGRLGCFFAGCCYGKATDSWIGLPCAAPYGVQLDINVYPTQLFEMGFLIVLAVIMSVLYFKFKFNYNFSVYLVSYGIWRFLIEFLRDDYRGTFIGSTLSPSQIWSLAMIVLAVGYFFLQKYLFAKCMKHPELSAAAEGAEG